MSQIIKAEFINPFLESTLNCLKMYADITAVKKNPSLKETLPEIYDISGIISLVGQLEGSAVVSFPKKLALYIVSSMWEEDITELNADVEDGIGEVANIIVGEARSKLKDAGYDVTISVPSVVVGKGHKISRSKVIPYVSIPFATNKGIFEVNVGIREVKK